MPLYNLLENCLDYAKTRSNWRCINRIFIQAYEGDTQRTSSKGCYLPNVETKDYDIMINGENFLINQ